MSKPVPSALCHLGVQFPGVPVPAFEFRSVSVAAVRITGARIAVRVRAVSGARSERVFAVIQKWVRVLLHADQFGIGASHELGILTQEHGNV